MAEAPKRVHDPPTGKTSRKKNRKDKIWHVWKIVEEITVPVRYRIRSGCGKEESEVIYL